MSTVALLVMGFWLILNGRIAWDTLAVGAAVTFTILMLGHCTGLWTLKREKCIYLLIPSGITYFFALLKEIFLANFHVIRLLITQKTSPCIRHYVTPLKTKAARAMLANSITLTPGTVTVQLVDNVLSVHCLTQEMAHGIENSALEKRLMKMEEKMYGRSI